MGDPNAFDFNNIEPLWTSRYHNRDEIIAGLRAHVKEWAPPLFPFAVNDGKQLRMADVYGRAPRARGGGGSCHVELEGDHAGDFFDFGTNEGGNPIGVIAYATGLWGKDLWDRAAEYGHVNGRANGHATKAPAIKKKKNSDTEINDILSQCVPIAGTLGEVYLKSRGLTDPQSPDLLFHPNCTDWEVKRGRPTIIAKLRDNDGNFIDSIHRIFLQDDGSGKADKQKQKMSLGKHGKISAAVRLYPFPADGRMGVAEGIETSIAAHILRNKLPVWPLLGMGNFENFVPLPGTTHLTIFTDRGEEATKRARALAQKVQMMQIECIVEETNVGMDFNDDLKASLGLPFDAYVPSATIDNEEPQTVTEEIIQPGLVGGDVQTSLLHGARTLPQGTSSEKIRDMMVAIAQNHLHIEPLVLTDILNEYKRASGLRLGDLRNQLRETIESLKPPKPPLPAWVDKAHVNMYGLPERCVSNVNILFDNLPATQKLFGYDEFAELPMVMRKPPWENSFGDFVPRALTDADMLAATVFVQNSGLIVPYEITVQGIKYCSYQLKFHPVKKYFDSLPDWDGKPRDTYLLLNYFGASKPKDTPENEFIKYCGDISLFFLISMIARIYEPGCKMDNVLVIEGRQDILKSTALEILATPWFAVHRASMANKEGQIQLRGKWLMELAELSSVKRADIESVKSFITDNRDNYRDVWDKLARDHPRQTVLAATTNERTWQRDATGGRRFWTARVVNPINTEALKEDRDQIFAEALHRYRSHDKPVWWLTDKEVIKTATEEQDRRKERDAWHDKIAHHLINTNMPITVSDILSNGLSIALSDQGRVEVDRVEKILDAEGYERASKSKVGGWIYKKHEELRDDD